MKRYFGSLTSKRVGALLGAVMITSSLGMTAAVAGPTYLGSKTYYDKAGDAPSSADVRRTNVTATGGAVWVTTKIASLPGVGRYRVYVDDFPWDARGSKLRVVVTKELSRTPVATLLSWHYSDGAWARVPCSMVVGWDTGTDIVKVQLPRRCSSLLEGANFSVSAADFTAGGVTDRIALDRRTW